MVVQYISKTVDFSPLLKDENEQINKCISQMEQEGYRFEMVAHTGIAWAVLVFSC